MTFTNDYAEIMKLTPEIVRRMDAKKRSLFSITFDEMWVYIGVYAIMGIVQKPNIAMYWSKD